MPSICLEGCNSLTPLTSLRTKIFIHGSLIITLSVTMASPSPACLDAETHQAEASPPPNPAPELPETVKVRVSLQTTKKRLYLYALSTTYLETGEDVIGRLRIKWDAEMSKMIFWHPLRSWLWKPVVDWDPVNGK